MSTIHWLLSGDNWQGWDGIPVRLVQHIKITLFAIGLAVVVALPVGLYFGHRRRGGFFAVNVSNIGRAIPTLAILIIFAATEQIGIGDRAAIYALAIFAIPPILTNTYVGMLGVDPDAVEAARGMGMRGHQVLLKVELPLALPLIAAGLRTASVQVVATATLAALVAGGGLGRFIVDGFAQQDHPEIYGGAVLVALLSIVTELVLGLVERRVTPGKRRPREKVLETIGVGA